MQWLKNSICVKNAFLIDNWNSSFHSSCSIFEYSILDWVFQWKIIWCCSKSKNLIYNALYHSFGDRGLPTSSIFQKMQSFISLMQPPSVALLEQGQITPIKQLNLKKPNFNFNQTCFCFLSEDRNLSWLWQKFSSVVISLTEKSQSRAPMESKKFTTF